MYSNQELKEKAIVYNNYELGITTARFSYEDVIHILFDDYYDTMHCNCQQVEAFVNKYLHGKALVAKSKCNIEAGDEYYPEIGEDIAKIRLVIYFKHLEAKFVESIVEAKRKELDRLIEIEDKAVRNYMLTADKSDSVIASYFGECSNRLIPMEDAVDFEK